MAKSVGKHFGVGYTAIYFSSIVQNLRYSSSYFGAVEYNFFPCSEATRKQLRVMYRIGFCYQHYYTRIIFGKLFSWYIPHSLVFTNRQVEKWGNIGLSFGGFHYDSHLRNYNFSVNPSISWNPVKGLSIGLYGGYSLVNDQFFLTADKVEDFEILLGQKALATNFSFWGGLFVWFNIQQRC